MHLGRPLCHAALPCHKAAQLCPNRKFQSAEAEGFASRTAVLETYGLSSRPAAYGSNPVATRSPKMTTGR